MKRILLAEDEEVLRMLIIDTLEGKDYLIDEAEDGKEALELIAKNLYDLIILDNMMPVFTGLEVVKKVRKDFDIHDLKILMLSAKSQKFEQEKIFAAGADYFIAKPFSPMELAAKIEGILDEQ